MIAALPGQNVSRRLPPRLCSGPYTGHSLGQAPAPAAWGHKFVDCLTPFSRTTAHSVGQIFVSIDGSEIVSAED